MWKTKPDKSDIWRVGRAILHGECGDIVPLGYERISIKPGESLATVASEAKAELRTSFSVTIEWQDW
jgi:hypothetical protein